MRSSGWSFVTETPPLACLAVGSRPRDVLVLQLSPACLSGRRRLHGPRSRGRGNLQADQLHVGLQAEPAVLGRRVPATTAAATTTTGTELLLAGQGELSTRASLSVASTFDLRKWCVCVLRISLSLSLWRLSLTTSLFTSFSSCGGGLVVGGTHPLLWSFLYRALWRFLDGHSLSFSMNGGPPRA